MIDGEVPAGDAEGVPEENEAEAGAPGPLIPLNLLE